ncbi:hypothetical protein FRB99_002055 [Tulasnella sp. 403]|nr:hypothetical protein FRB99_002055 [Tulasnella sp. 403]
MESVSDDPDTVHDFDEVAKALNIPTQTALIIFFVIFTVLCMAVTLGTWYMHHRLHEEQRRLYDEPQTGQVESKGGSFGYAVLEYTELESARGRKGRYTNYTPTFSYAAVVCDV